ncbi:MAG: hypothetical protein V2I65_15710 [Paracoccaceae bacterium]|jgi:hypothetical protein|nr:hypothetical protein [Paracoccaceae bacterium]
MPDYYAILTLYQVYATAEASGALSAERNEVAAHALDRVAEGFLTGSERTGWGGLAAEARRARLRIGRQRLRRWEMANPDIVALLRRRAGSAALG